MTGKFKEEFLHPKGKPLNQLGQELLDPTPIAPPVGYKKQPSMVDHIRNMVRSELLRAHAESEGFGSFEEEDDFDVGDDYEPTSGYENDFDPVPPEAVPPAPTPSNPPPDGPDASSGDHQ